MMRRMMRDLRLALRWTWRNRGFSAVAVATLAVAIAANAIVFALVKTVLLTPLPYADPDRLVVVADANGKAPASTTISYATAQDWLSRSRALERLSLYADSGIRPIVDGRVEQLRGMRVSADFFDTLGVPMYLGRSFTPADDTPGVARVAILTYDSWRDVFRADPGIVGRTIPTRGGAYLVAGVLPRGFQPLHMTNPAELPRVFIPLGLDTAREREHCRGCNGYRAIARLAPSRTVAAARTELSGVMRALASEYPRDYASDSVARIQPLRDALIGTFGRALWLLQAAVLLLLVLACANVATLLLARAVGRQREVDVRVALGAAPRQLLRQLLAESLVLGTAAAGAGVALAWFGTASLSRSGATTIPRLAELTPDRTILLFGMLAAVVTSFAFGLLPAWLAARRAADSLHGGRTTSTPTSRRTLDGLIGLELTMAFVLVLVVGLLAKSSRRLSQVDPGFDARDVVTVTMIPDYPVRAQSFRYFNAIIDRLRGTAGVERVGYASTLPFSHPSTTRLFVRERPVASPLDAPALDLYLISDGYLEAMRIPVQRGRGIDARDTAASEPVALLSAAAARTLFAGGDPIGQHVQIGEVDPAQAWARVVGVVGDVHQYALDQAANAAVYLPFTQARRPQGYASLVVRSTLPAAAAGAAMRNAMLAIDPMQPVFHLQPMTTYLALSTSERTFTLLLMLAFGAISLALAAGGVYAVVSFVVAQRTREMGLRLALGAHPAQVVWLVVRQILVIGGTGIAAGLAIAAAGAQSLTAFLFALTPLDPMTIAEVALALIGAVFAASFVPSLRAARVDPAIALRAE